MFQYFEYKGDFKTECTLCKEEVPTGIFNLIRHLEEKHRELFNAAYQYSVAAMTTKKEIEKRLYG